MKHGCCILLLFLLISPGSSLAVSPSQAECDYGDAWAELGNWTRALEFYRRAVEREPKLTVARLRLAEALYQLGDRVRALETLDRLKVTELESAEIAATKGNLLLLLDRPLEACQGFERALGLDPNCERAWFGAGQCYLALYGRDHQEASKKLSLQAFQELVTRFPEGPYAGQARERLEGLAFGELGPWMAEAKSQLAAGQHAQAEEALRRVLSRRPELPEAHYLMGLVLSSREGGSAQRADEEFRLAGDLPEALLQRGTLAYEEDDLERAEAFLRQAIEQAPRHAKAHYTLGLVLRDRQKPEEAACAFRQAMALAPKTALAERASSKLQVLTGELQQLSEGEVIDPSGEIELGRTLSTSIERQFGLVADRKLQERLGRILDRLLSHSDRLPTVALRVKVLDIEGVNALSLVGGTLYLFRGVIDFVREQLGDSDDVLAAVMGHELAHLSNRHGLDVRGLTKNGQTLLQGRPLDVLDLQQLSSGLERAQEYEADLLGALYTYRAGFDPSAAIRFHAKLRAAGREVPRGLQHPTHGERADRLREYLLQLRTRARRFDEGLAALKANNFEEAIAQFEVYLGLFPGSPAGRNNLGVAQLRLAMARGGATPPYRLSTHVDPRSEARPILLRAKGEAGEAFYREVQLREAQATFRAVSRNHPGYLPAKQNLACCLLLQQRPAEARTLLEDLLRQRPHSTQLRANLAVSYLQEGTVERGLALLEQLVRERPRSALAAYNLALALEAAGRIEPARAAWQAFLALAPDSAWAPIARARLASLGPQGR